MGIDAGKTGMLGTRGIIEEVAATVSKLGFPLVVDPVMVAKSGAPLIAEDAMANDYRHIFLPPGYLAQIAANRLWLPAKTTLI